MTEIVEKAGKGVLVIGGGIAGIQSALDLANSGVQVYLIERGSTLGGRMAQLDKTFPTNDCSMCILSPKLVAAARHPKIKLLTMSELIELDGEAGDFQAKVLKVPRSIDESKCVGCGLCIDNCPVMLAPQIDDTVMEPQVQDKEYLDELLGKNSNFANPIVQVMLAVNDKYRYLPKDVLEYLSFKMEMPLSEIYRLATFYKSFSLEMRGTYHVKICMGTACHVRGARRILDRVRTVVDKFGDGIFSIETVNCLGACALGPIIVVNEEVHGHVTNDDVDKTLTGLGNAESTGAEGGVEVSGGGDE